MPGWQRLMNAGRDPHSEVKLLSGSIEPANHLVGTHQDLRCQVGASHLHDLIAIAPELNIYALSSHRCDFDNRAFERLPMNLRQHHVGRALP
jgi:hypothetical protein